MASYFAKFVKQAEQDMQSFVRDFQEPIREAVAFAQQAAKVYEQYRETIQQALETYRRYAEQIRQMAERFVQFYQSLNIPTAIRQAIQIGQKFLLGFFLDIYNRLCHPRDATESELLALTYEDFPIEYRRFRNTKHLPDTKESRLQFIAYLLAVAKSVDQKHPLDQDNLLTSLHRFFTKLFYAIRDFLRQLNRSLQETRANEQSAYECSIEVDGQRYLLIPSLSIQTGVSQPTLRRYAGKGLFDAVKLPYTSERSGHTNPAWHFPYTPKLVDQIKEHAGKKRFLHETLYSRKQVVSILGINVDTLRNWERKGLINSVRKAGKAFYDQSELPKCKELLAKNNKPRFDLLMARA